MYITVGWTVLAGESAAGVEAEIVSTIRKYHFVNPVVAHAQLALANIERDYDPDQAQLLHDELRQLAPARYSYVITVSPNLWDLVASDDVETASASQLRTIVTYRT